MRAYLDVAGRQLTVAEGLARALDAAGPGEVPVEAVPEFAKLEAHRLMLERKLRGLPLGQEVEAVAKLRAGGAYRNDLLDWFVYQLIMASGAYCEGDSVPEEHQRAIENGKAIEELFIYLRGLVTSLARGPSAPASQV